MALIGHIYGNILARDKRYWRKPLHV